MTDPEGLLDTSTLLLPRIADPAVLPELYTCNPGDFADIDGLTVRAVPIPL